MTEHASAADELERIVASVRQQFEKCSTPQQQRDLRTLFVDRVPTFVDRSLREVEARRTNRSQIEACVGTLHASCIGHYLHNADLNAYYEVHAHPVRLQLVASDRILLKLANHIPANLANHRIPILRAVRALVCTQSVFDWAPPAHVMQRMIAETNRNFRTTEEAVFFMKLIGTIVLRKEDAMAQESSTNQMALVHLWHGPRAEEVVQQMQRVVYNATHTFSSFWNKVKSRMHRTYTLPNICYLHFPAIAPKTPFRVIQQSTILFLATCCQLFRQDPTFVSTTCAVRLTRDTTCTLDLFSKYIRDSLVLSTPADDQPRFLLLYEILDDFGEYLSRNSLPADILTKQEVLQHIDSTIQYETYGTLCRKKLYHASFQASRGDTLQELFLQFCNDMIYDQPMYTIAAAPGSLANADTDTTTTADTTTTSTTDHGNPVVTTQQLHNNYRMWCKHYVSTTEPTDNEPMCDSQHHRHWYCSYKLFVVLFNRLYKSPLTSAIQLHPPVSVWKFYIGQYVGENQNESLEQWALSKFGIHIPHICSISNADLLETTDRHSILHEFEHYAHSAHSALDVLN
jgi:hypothetical protein